MPRLLVRWVAEQGGGGLRQGGGSKQGVHCSTGRAFGLFLSSSFLSHFPGLVLSFLSYLLRTVSIYGSGLGTRLWADGMVLLKVCLGPELR
jgi:hypothetical protein